MLKSTKTLQFKYKKPLLLTRNTYNNSKKKNIVKKTKTAISFNIIHSFNGIYNNIP